MRNWILSIIVALGIAGCDLTETPSSITSDNLAGDVNGAEQLVTGVYAVMWDSYMMKKTYMEWLDMDHDHTTAENWVLAGAGEGNVTSHWGYNGGSDLFNAFYLIINRANIAEEALLKAPINENKKIGQRYGEVLFLRAWAYFHLVRMYGPVPLRLQAITPTDMPRASVKEVFGAITADLEKAIGYLQYPSSGYVGGWGHADRTAAQLLLARVYATMGSGKLATQNATIKVNINGNGNQTFTADAVAGYEQFDAAMCYTKVKALCDTAILRRGVDFNLRNSFKDIWGSPNVRNNEFVWGIASAPLFETEHLHYYYTARPFGGNTWVTMSQGLYNQYEDTDTRKIEGVFHYFKTTYNSDGKWYRFPSGSDYNTPPGGGEVTDLPASASYQPMPIITKWYNGDISNPTLKTVADQAKSVKDVILIRYVDAYLLKAEAENELGNAAGALEALNVVRSRSKASTYSGISDVADIRSLVLKERALEFSQEFNRKFDLLRWGLYLKVMNATGSISNFNKQTISKVREPRCILFPVPTAEVNSNKLFGANNPGW